MSKLNDRDRRLLNGLELQLEHDDPAWVRQFADATPTRRTRRNLLRQTAIGVLLLLAACGLLLGIPGVVACASAAAVLALIRYRL